MKPFVYIEILWKWEYYGNWLWNWNNDFSCRWKMSEIYKIYYDELRVCLDTIITGWKPIDAGEIIGVVHWTGGAGHR